MRNVDLTFAEGGDHADPAAVCAGLMTSHAESKELDEPWKVRMFTLCPDILTWDTQVECHPDSLWIHLLVHLGKEHLRMCTGPLLWAVFGKKHKNVFR